VIWLARTRVAVVFGGRSVEHPVSVRTAQTVLANLDRDRYEVLGVKVTRTGIWRLGDSGDELLDGHEIALPDTGQVGVWRSMAGAVALLRTADVAFPLLHGAYGEDGTIQSLLEIAGIPYVGNGVIASAIGMDKEFTKKILAADGLPVAKSVLLHAMRPELPMPEVMGLGLPVFVKPARSGSSLGVSKVDDWDDLPAAVATAMAVDAKVLVEEAVIGREVELGLLEYPDGRLETGPPMEIQVGGDRIFYDYYAKYDDSATILAVPTDLGPELTARLRRYAVEAFESLGCAGLLRVDFFLRDGVEPVINEVNTFPGFTATSAYPQIWAAAGLGFRDLLTVLITTALTRADARATVPGIGR
jgi:D-alanine-D-alanine ligase